MNKVILWIGAICLIAWFFWIVILPLFKKSENFLKLKARDINIMQIKHSIKELQITKEELFDE